MAEVLGAIGSLGAIVNIIDGTAKAISAISNLRAQWKDADLTLRGLSSQLSAFEAALRLIQEWRDSEPLEPHYQLVMELDKSLAFCAELVDRLRVHFVEWESSIERPTAVSSRFKAVFGGKGLDNLLKHVERQTSVLNLLLNVCNKQTRTEQKKHLEKFGSRKTLRQAKASSASLLSRPDTASSFRSSWTIFEFDATLRSSEVYNRVRDLRNYRIRIHEERGWLMLKREESSPGPLDDVGPGTLTEERTLASTHQSYMSAQEYLEPLTPPSTPPADVLLCIDHLDIIETTVDRMLEDCARCTVIMAKHVPRLQSKHRIPSPLLLRPREKSSYLSNMEKFWKHQDFGRLLQNISTSEHYTTRQTDANPETIAQLFLHELKSVGEGRLRDHISTCVHNLSTSHAHAEILHNDEEGSSMSLQAYLTWSKGSVKLEEIWSNLPFPRNAHESINILTVTVNVRMRHDVNSHPAPDLAGLIDGRLNSWIDTAKGRRPNKIVLLLLVEGMEYFLPWSVDASASAEETGQVHSVYRRIMEVFQLFGSIQTSLPNEYLMVWDSPHFAEHVLGSLAARFPPSARMKRHDTVVSMSG